MLKRIEKILNEKIINSSSLGGGSIASANKITTQSGKNYFYKTYSNRKIHHKEANGLCELRKTKTIRIPEVIAVNDDFLLLEYIETGIEKPDFSENFGVMFAKMHKTKSDKFGFYEDNYLGKTFQKNTPCFTNWVEFYWENRLLYQLRLAEKRGYATKELIEVFNKLESKITSIITTDEKPTIIHGDLWSGNYMVDKQGNACIIDPAIYYGHREADLAMTRIFGGFDFDFYRAYEKEYPLEDGHKYREGIYEVYHIINHLNSFGTTYYGQTISLLKQYI